MFRRNLSAYRTQPRLIAQNIASGLPQWRRIILAYTVPDSLMKNTTVPSHLYLHINIRTTACYNYTPHTNVFTDAEKIAGTK